MVILKKIFCLIIILIVFIISASFAIADENTDRLNQLSDQIKELEQKIKENKGEQKTLSSAIVFLDNKIKLTTTQIAVTEKELEILENEISQLTVKIDKLDKSLTEVSKILASRIEATYKRGKVQPVYLLFSAKGFSQFFTRLKYLKTAQLHDREIMFTMEESKLTYDQQKKLKEKKQAEQEALKKKLADQKTALAQQKASKQELLNVTKNDERRFQSLLAAARAEMEAIQSIMAGKGDEVEAGDIHEGDKIANIIVGASVCSTGTHLHFEVVKNSSHTNPASYLKSKDVSWDLCGWYGCDDPFSFSGDWNWPMNDQIRVTQGYGMTAYARSGAYGGSPHTGLDMVSEDRSVKSVKEGKLYRGSIACGGGTLRYVKVDHKDSDTDTYYLHINYY